MTAAVASIRFPTTAPMRITRKASPRPRAGVRKAPVTMRSRLKPRLPQRAALSNSPSVRADAGTGSMLHSAGTGVRRSSAAMRAKLRSSGLLHFDRRASVHLHGLPVPVLVVQVAVARRHVQPLHHARDGGVVRLPVAELVGLEGVVDDDLSR